MKAKYQGIYHMSLPAFFQIFICISKSNIFIFCLSKEINLKIFNSHHIPRFQKILGSFNNFTRFYKKSHPNDFKELQKFFEILGDYWRFQKFLNKFKKIYEFSNILQN